VAAARRGDYGIASALVVPVGAFLVVCLGASTLLSSQDPAGHAEMGAIRAFRRLVPTTSATNASTAAGQLDLNRCRQWGSSIAVAKGDDECYTRHQPMTELARPTLYTTLEPCPMCTVAIINAGITHVVIGSPDEKGGALASDRLDRLAPIWPELATAQNLKVDFLDRGPGSGNWERYASSMADRSTPHRGSSVIPGQHHAPSWWERSVRVA
jgi:tRNA(Arg) A34 adenosine deaminase TadA